jgi:hypothetical protein
VLCKACGYLLGPLARVRRFGHDYFISDYDFYNRIEEKKSPVRQDYSKTAEIGNFFPSLNMYSMFVCLFKGKALCGNKSCRSQVGRIQVLKDHPTISPIYPLKCLSIKIRQIEPESRKENIILGYKWSKMPFKIPTFEDECANNDDIFYDAYDTLLSD